jgi:hypothetical protein
MMKTFLSIVFAGLISTAVAQVDTAENVVHSTVRGTEKAAKTVVHGAAKAVDTVEDAFEPEPNAQRVDVNLTENSVDMPTSLKPGRTAFVIKNSGSATHNFEVQGHGVDREFKNAPKPGQIKVLHVTLKRGTYTAYSLGKDGNKEAAKVSFRVK